jgi:DnaJ-class molecular chaperone
MTTAAQGDLDMSYSLPHGEVDDADREATCPECGEPAEWTDCDDCGGLGFDPVLSEAGVQVEEECETCGGNGGWYYCPQGCEGERSVENYLK